MAGCASDRLVHEIKLLSFEADVGKGKSMGEVSGEICSIHIFGLWLGTKPDLASSLLQVRNNLMPNVDQTSGSAASADTNHLRYLNNIALTESGTELFLFGRKCLRLTGLGFL
jgi:hypothetical protein